jgi:ATP-grasp domain, R2K clade family 3
MFECCQYITALPHWQAANGAPPPRINTGATAPIHLVYHGGPPVAQFAGIARTVRSRFFTMDVAERTDGVWRIVELGDGQVAWADDQVGLAAFYESLAGA